MPGIAWTPRSWHVFRTIVEEHRQTFFSEVRESAKQAVLLQKQRVLGKDSHAHMHFQGTHMYPSVSTISFKSKATTVQLVLHPANILNNPI